MYPLEDNVDEDDLKAAVVLCFYHFPLCSMHATIYNLYVYSIYKYIRIQYTVYVWYLDFSTTAKFMYSPDVADIYWLVLNVCNQIEF